MAHQKAIRLFSADLLFEAVLASLKRLTPRYQLRNPVMFVVYVGAIVTTVAAILPDWRGGETISFIVNVAVWLWITVLFANFAEAIAEGRGKAQAATLKGSRRNTMAKKLLHVDDKNPSQVVSTDLRVDHHVLVEAGDVIPSDGQVVKGVASVDESAITGESAPVIREKRRRPRCRDGRHARFVRLAGRAHYG